MTQEYLHEHNLTHPAIALKDLSLQEYQSSGGTTLQRQSSTFIPIQVPFGYQRVLERKAGGRYDRSFGGFF